jgi:ppGpp synthetase/RelA/SpoT-type nucleotidyltranferase
MLAIGLLLAALLVEGAWPWQLRRPRGGVFVGRSLLIPAFDEALRLVRADEATVPPAYLAHTGPSHPGTGSPPMSPPDPRGADRSNRARALRRSLVTPPPERVGRRSAGRVPTLSEDDVRRFLDRNRDVFMQAIAEVERLVGFFIADWADVWGFSVEQIESARIKDDRRVFAKAQRKGLSDAGGLLRRCDEKDGRRRFPVHDLLGVRVLVRSLNDVAAVQRALADLRARGGEVYPLGNRDDFDLEDINGSPRPSGYRALHVDGSVTVRVAERDFTVPFEIQVKTLAQHVFGQHTHEEAYVPDEANRDQRYEVVRILQKALAEQLNAADLLLATLEDAADAVRDSIARGARSRSRPTGERQTRAGGGRRCR